MAIDISTITASITEGQVAAILVCLAFGVAIWSVRAIKLLRDDGSAQADSDDDLGGYPCPNCGSEEWNNVDEDDCYVCVVCGHEEYDAETAYERSREID